MHGYGEGGHVPGFHLGGEGDSSPPSNTVASSPKKKPVRWHHNSVSHQYLEDIVTCSNFHCSTQDPFSNWIICFPKQGSIISKLYQTASYRMRSECSILDSNHHFQLKYTTHFLIQRTCTSPLIFFDMRPWSCLCKMVWEEDQRCITLRNSRKNEIWIVATMCY